MSEQDCQCDDCRLRRAVPDMLAALLPCLDWLEYAYGNVDSVTATAVKAHLPAIRAAIAKATATTDTHRDHAAENAAVVVP